MTFHFKSFSITQEQSAMKVGTDGVLLGAWSSPTSYPHKILDIGTGTGLIAIMLAQRFTDSEIHAIDIDEATAQEAQINAQSSPFSERLKIQHCALQNFSPKENFDLIVSNPPYFRKTTKSNNRRRALARDNETLNLEYLIEKSYDLLSNNGNLSLITPAYEFEIIEAIAQNKGFFITRICWVKGNNNSPTKRVLINLSKKKDQVKENYLTIEKNRHNFTEEYRDLCKDFYVKM